MKKLKKTGIGAVLLALILGLVFTGCGDSSNGSVISGLARKSVTDGVYRTTAQGYSPHTPLAVETTLINDRILRIRIEDEAETIYMKTAVEEYLIPRILQSQSLGVDVTSGATYTSVGLKNAIAAAIDAAGGDSSEWYDEPSKDSGTVTLPEGGGEYDVIVVGLGGTGTAAYASASERTTANGNEYYPSVFGLEASSTVGGSSIAASGPFEVYQSLHAIKSVPYGKVSQLARI